MFSLKNRSERKLASITKQIDEAEYMFPCKREGLIKALLSVHSNLLRCANAELEISMAEYYLGILQADTYDQDENAYKNLKKALGYNKKEVFLSDKKKYVAYCQLAKSAFYFDYIDETIDCLKESELLALKEDANESKLGALQNTGFLYHYFGFYEDALKLNLSILKEAEDSLGEDNTLTINIRRNVAENYYSLEKDDLAEAVLNQIICLAELKNDYELHVEALFKIGVISHESNLNEKAKQYMDESLKVARQSGNEDLILTAQSRLDELSERSE